MARPLAVALALAIMASASPEVDMEEVNLHQFRKIMIKTDHINFKIKLVGSV